MSLLDLSPGGQPPRAATGGGETASEALCRLGGTLANLLPAALLCYVFLIWPLAFADAGSSPIEEQLGWLAPLDNGGGGSTIWKQLAYPILFLIAAFCLLTTGTYRRIPFTRTDIGAVLLVALVALASVMWSIEPRESLMRAALLTMIILTIVFSVYASSSFRLLVQAVFIVFVATAAANLVAVLVLPPSPIGYTGIYAQKNVLGLVGAIILFFGLAHLTTGGWMTRLAALAMIATAALLLVLSQSKTSLGLALLAPPIAAILTYLARRSLSPAVVVPVGVAVMAGIYIMGSVAGAWDLAALNAAVFGDPTLTGRTGLWSFASGLVGERPLLGWGYEAVWGHGYEGLTYKRAIGFARVAPTGHNGYVDIVLYMGLLGAFVLLAAIVVALASAGRLARVDAKLGWLSLTIAVFVLLHNNLESDLFISSNNASMLFLVFHVVAARRTGK